jgi:hypothetical protein
MVKEGERDIAGPQIAEECFGSSKKIGLGWIEEGFGSEDSVISGEIVAKKVIHTLFAMEAREEAREVLVSGA